MNRFFLDLSLNKKLILMMLFMSFSLISVLFFLYWQSEKALFEELAKQTADLSKAIQVGVEEVTASGSTDQTRLAQYFSKLNSKGIKQISIISNADEIIASTDPAKVGSVVGPKRKELIIKAELGDPVSEEGKAYNVMVPVIIGDLHYGYIHLTINVEDFTQLLRQNFIKRLFAAILVFGIAIGIAAFLTFRFTEPIHSVVDAARKVAAGDFDQTLPAGRKDEIGELTESFNFMVKRLKENKEIEERLREAEHLSAVGQLSRTIAHEIRNPLNFISLSIDHIGEKYRPGDSGKAMVFSNLVSSIKQEIHRLNKLVSDFLDYGKPLKLNLQSANIGEVLSSALDIIRVKAKTEQVKLLEHLDFLPDITMDPELIKTCVLNVLINAFQAMPEGGEISLSTARSNGKFVLSISDTGTGISEENLPKVFDPFFTTKSSGLGLGLATTKRIIEEHSGKIEMESVPGAGSMVSITLPLS